MSAAAAKLQKQSNVIKASPPPKRPIDDADHLSQLWVDHEFLRKHLSSKPKFLIPEGSAMAVNNRYLELADLALSSIETISSRGWSGKTAKKKRRSPTL